jgi:F0F1-type ATP synthase membrane subunit c/vacuolar-type H+-ATPase subunit K
MTATAMGNEDKDLLKRKYLTINFVGLVIIAAVFIYATLVEIIKRFFAPFTGFVSLTGNFLNIIRFILLVSSVAGYFLIKIIQRKYASRPSPNLPLAAIITFTLCEAVALWGLILFLLSGQALDFYIFMTISLAFFYIFFPRYDHWEKLMEQSND